MSEKHFCYILKSQTTSKTYTGYTPNLSRRLHRHNNTKQGAKYTRSGRPWGFAAYVSGFKNKIDALRFEYAVKHAKRGHGLAWRGQCLVKVLNKEKWTSNSPPSKDYPLKLHWMNTNIIPTAPYTLPNYIEEIYHCDVTVRIEE